MALVLTKSADKVNVLPGDIVTYTVTIENTDPLLSETNITFTDIIPDGATFIPDTFAIENIPQPGENPNVGVSIPDIAAGDTVTISYQVKIDEQPAPVQITNIAQASSTLEGEDVPTTAFSNPFTVNVAVANIYKSADRTIVSLTEEISYTIIITNIGAVTLTAPELKDILPECLSFVPESFSVDGVTDPLADPTVGVTLSDINPGDIVSISFRGKVTCIPCPPKFNNIATLTYGILVTEDGPTILDTITTNEVSVTAALSAFKQLSREEYVQIPVQKPDIEEILNTLVDIKIINTKVITTPAITSLEGQKLTGYKLIVEGILNQKVEYVADEPQQSVHAAHFRVPFSSFIVLPTTYDGGPVEVEGVVEDVFWKLVDKRTIFKNITFLITAKF